MRIHLIAMGGAIMHQIAITSARKGHEVTGSDDVIQEPSRTRLQEAGLLPEKEGFFADNVDAGIDLVILGMHAKFDNPELSRAMELGIKVLSFPEYIYENSLAKTRAVIAGSHGKTSITSMIMHCLKEVNIDFDYLVGSSVAGFEYSVRLSDAPIIVIEGDEYLASPITKEPKFIYYKAHIATISGIEWDHINVFKTEEIYNEQFKKLLLSMESNGRLFYYQDEKIVNILKEVRSDVDLIPYQNIAYEVKDEIFYAVVDGESIPLAVFGKHNMENIQAAKHVCNSLGMDDVSFWKGIQTFTGAGRRLELILEDDRKIVYKDFAHSPSKLTATVKAVKEKYPQRWVVACFELHTFSSLKQEFLPQYENSLSDADVAIVYMDKTVVEQKGNQIFSEDEIRKGFHRDDIIYITDRGNLESILRNQLEKNPVYLMMSSGTFSGMNLATVGENILSNSNVEIERENLSTSTQDVFQNINSSFTDSVYSTQNLNDEERRTLYIVFSLSYIFFILPSLFVWLKDRQVYTDKMYNLLTAMLNFQTLSMIVLTLGIFSGTFMATAFVASFAFNVWTVHRAINMLTERKDLDIPSGIMAFMPKLDKS